MATSSDSSAAISSSRCRSHARIESFRVASLPRCPLIAHHARNSRAQPQAPYWSTLSAVAWTHSPLPERDRASGMGSRAHVVGLAGFEPGEKSMSAGTSALPVLRWVGLLWMVVWLPAYIRIWGWTNLLHLCDIAVMRGCAGLWGCSSLPVCSHAGCWRGAGSVWVIDVGWRLVTGRLLVGGTGYMWVARFPVRARLLSTFLTRLP